MICGLGSGFVIRRSAFVICGSVLCFVEVFCDLWKYFMICGSVQ